MSTQYYVNGKIFTGRNETDFVSAMKVADGQVEWIGRTEDVTDPNRIDLQGRTVLPGFIDSHIHPTYVAGILDQVACLPPQVNSIAEMIEALKKQDAARSENEWIEGWGYDESKLEEHRSPTREDLDKVSADRPVYVMRSDLHSSAVNSKALELANITKDTKDVYGGRIGRYENGEPTGVLTENASSLVERIRPKKSLEDYVSELVNASKHFAERGITSVTEMMGLVVPYNYLDLYREAEKKGFKQQAVLYIIWDELKANGITELKQSDLVGRVRIGGIKLFADGSMSGQTAWMKKPYPGTDDVYGIPRCTREDLLEACEFAKKHGIQVSVHAMGDAAIQLVIDTFKNIEPWVSDGPSVRIEHSSVLSTEQIKEIEKCRMAAVQQIIFFFAEYESYRQNLDDERFNRTYPLKSLYEGCKYTALSSDAPATTWAEPDNVLTSIKAAVTRTAYNNKEINANEKITVEQAVLLYTKKGQEVCRIPKTGTLQPDNEADFIILDQDIFTIEPENIDKINIVSTFICGEKVF